MPSVTADKTIYSSAVMTKGSGVGEWFHGHRRLRHFVRNAEGTASQSFQTWASRPTVETAIHRAAMGVTISSENNRLVVCG